MYYFNHADFNYTKTEETEEFSSFNILITNGSFSEKYSINMQVFFHNFIYKKLVFDALLSSF